MDVLAVLQDEADRTAKLVREVQPDQLGLATPCTGFDVRSLINHLCLGADFVARAAAGEKAMPDYDRDFVDDDPAGAYEREKDAMLAAVRVPGLAERMVYFAGPEVPGAVLLAFALMDSVVHRWDLARALGVDPGIDPGTAVELIEQVKLIVPDEMRAASIDEVTASIPFGPPVEVPADSSPVDKLVAFLGRTP